MRELKMARSLLEEAQTSIQAGEHSAAPARMRVIVVLTSPTAVYEADLLAMVEFDLRASDAVVHTVSILDLRNHHQLSAPAFFGPLQRLLQDELHDSWAEAPSAWAALLGCPPEFPPASGTSARTSARSRTPHRLSPPHRRKTSVFRPEHVFDDLYRDLCHAARGIHGHPDPGHHCDAIRDSFIGAFSHISPQRSSPGPCPVSPVSEIFSTYSPPVATHKTPGRGHSGWGRDAGDDHTGSFAGPREAAGWSMLVSIVLTTFQPTLLLSGDAEAATAVLMRGGQAPSLEQIWPTTTPRPQRRTRNFPILREKPFQPVCGVFEKWHWLRFVMAPLKDGSYDSGALDRTIQSICQRECRLFDAMTPSTAGRRLAIIVSRISDGKSCVFPNHRGVGGAGVDPTSQATVSSDLSQNPLLWEVVGAPWFFHCKHLPEFETLQNGGVRGNNHSGIAQEECRIIWPSAQTFDLLISSGQDMSRLSLRSTFRVNTLAAPYRTGLLYACGVRAIRPPVWMVRKPSRKDSNTYRILCDLPASSRRRW
ncbi:hypothetical protein LV156_008792 [Aspergillus fumigatus]|nr:hypothetical protein LV156_008792 [Aspergillus fumigatus]KAJ8228513.1 hypothetical protein LV160_008775 [Aspergillus fumigatus]